MRLILGLIKGIVIGGLVGLGAHQLGLDGGWNWVTYGLVGSFVGLLVGRPIWSHLVDKNSTVVVAVLKAIVGYLIGIGLYALVAKAWGSFEMTDFIRNEPRYFHNFQPLFGGILGGVYGAWVEVDDAPSKSAEGKKES